MHFNQSYSSRFWPPIYFDQVSITKVDKFVLVEKWEVIFPAKQKSSILEEIYF